MINTLWRIDGYAANKDAGEQSIVFAITENPTTMPDINDALDRVNPGAVWLFIESVVLVTSDIEKERMPVAAIEKAAFTAVLHKWSQWRKAAIATEDDKKEFLESKFGIGVIK